ncbi:PorT family protein [Pedobacter sp. BS3]|uniref:outer membrane beta-barrel protein n=1 Tax=Pedobacter sp. BS3 TaxID=2567937 RepID=UPI0011ED1963|nr:outer membrane beta-barrel protein [Pedobacter sp. BS3]TZF80914.1 PorT family protein [Pedobacter sp. BS3]
MKKALSILAILLIPGLLKAQRHNFKLGFTASPTFGWMKFNGSDASSYKTDGLAAGFSYGVLGDFGFTPNYFFSTAFTVTTVKADVIASNPSQKLGYKIQYLDIPLSLKLKSNDFVGGKFYGQFGFDLGVKTSNGITTSDVSRFRAGLLLGGGVEWQVRTLDILTGVSYNNGFTKAIKNPDAKLSYLTLNLGVFF